MAIQTLGQDGSSVLGVDPTHKAARTSIFPVEVLAYNSIGAQTGAITGLAAGAPIFTLRNAGTNLILVRRVGLIYIQTTAFTTAQVVDFGITVARAFTVSDSGGTAISVTGNNLKHRTSLATPTSMDARVATTTGLTAGTRTLDTNTLSQVGVWAGAIGAGIPVAQDNLFATGAGDHPLILAQNEGLIIDAVTAFGATGVGRAYVNIEFAEVASY